MVSEEKAAVAEKKEEKVEEKKEVEVSAKMGKIIKTIEELTVLELSELVKAIEDRFGAK